MISDILFETIQNIKNQLEDDFYSQITKSKAEIVINVMNCLKMELDRSTDITIENLAKIIVLYEGIRLKTQKIFEILILDLKEEKDRLRKDGVEVREWTKEEINKLNNQMGKDILKFKE